MTIEVSSLSNGMRIATDHMDGIASAAVGVWVDVGSRYETEAQSGLSHFLEHMAFKGTGSRTALEIASAIESGGGFMNAYTSHERTAYFVRLLSEEIGTAIEILADILRDSRFAEEDVELERQVILQEIGRNKDSPEDCVRNNIMARIFPDHPLGRDILGTVENVSSFQPGDLRSFIADYYHPSRMLLSAAGDVTHSVIRDHAESLFGDMRGNNESIQCEPARFNSGESREEKDLEQVQLALALPAPNRSDPARHAATAFATVLGGNMSSRLFQEVRERRGLCYTVGAWCSRLSDTGMMAILSGTGPESVHELGTVVADELCRAVGDIEETEVARVRKQLRASILMGLESPWTRCERLASEVLTFRRPVPVEEILSDVEAISVDATRSAGQRMISDGSFAMAVYGNIAGAPSVEELNRRIRPH